MGMDWSASYPSGPSSDYRGPSLGNYRVFIAAHYNYGSCQQTGNRINKFPHIEDSFTGFRLALRAIRNMLNLYLQILFLRYCCLLVSEIDLITEV